MSKNACSWLVEHILTTACYILFLTFLPASAFAADWPWFRGHDRNGISSEDGWLTHWPAAGARVAWTAQVGKGHSAMSVVGNRGYTMGWDGRRDSVYCLDLKTGATLWSFSYDCPTIVQWPGPRSTVTVHGSLAIALSQHGHLHALDASTGKLVWKKQLARTLIPDDDYGFAWSPLVNGKHLILPGGVSGMALDIATGNPVWGRETARSACASPVPFRHGSTTAAVLLSPSPDRNTLHITAVDLATGRPLWRYEKWAEKWGAACIDPVVRDGKVFLTTSEQLKRGARFSITGDSLRQDWATNDLASYTSGLILLGNHLYGIDFKKRGRLVCVDWESGREKWSQGGFGQHAAMIAAGNSLLIQCSDSGDLIAVAAVPEMYRELRSQRVFADDAKTFTMPVIANGRIYCRSYAGKIVCLDVSGSAGR